MTDKRDIYDAWIAGSKACGVKTFGKCYDWVQEMHRAFPELLPIRGHVELSNFLVRPHWWLKTADGDIVDPTADQFSSEYYGISTIILSYEEYTGEEPKGNKCMNCGASPTYYDYHSCSSECEKALEAT